MLLNNVSKLTLLNNQYYKVSLKKFDYVCLLFYIVIQNEPL